MIQFFAKLSHINLNFSQNDDIVHDKSGDVKIRRTALVDVEKVHSTIKAIVRDWSEEGADERKMSYGPILERLETVFQGKRKQDIQVIWKELMSALCRSVAEYWVI